MTAPETQLNHPSRFDRIQRAFDTLFVKGTQNEDGVRNVAATFLVAAVYTDDLGTIGSTAEYLAGLLDTKNDWRPDQKAELETYREFCSTALMPERPHEEYEDSSVPGLINAMYDGGDDIVLYDSVSSSRGQRWKHPSDSEERGETNALFNLSIAASERAHRFSKLRSKGMAQHWKPVLELVLDQQGGADTISDYVTSQHILVALGIEAIHGEPVIRQLVALSYLAVQVDYMPAPDGTTVAQNMYGLSSKGESLLVLVANNERARARAGLAV